MTQLLHHSTSLENTSAETLPVPISHSSIFLKELKPLLINYRHQSVLYLQTAQRRKMKLVGEVPPWSFLDQIHSITHLKLVKCTKMHVHQTW